jgi:hypothetical protein
LTGNPACYGKARRINRYLSAEVREGELCYGHADMQYRRPHVNDLWRVGCLHADVGDSDRAKRLQGSGP